MDYRDPRRFVEIAMRRRGGTAFKGQLRRQSGMKQAEDKIEIVGMSMQTRET